MTDAPEAAPAAEPTPAETAQAEVSTLQNDDAWRSDFLGLGGREKQLAAAQRKSELTRAAQGVVDEPAPVLPEHIQKGLDSQSAVDQAAAESMIPPQSVDDYQFQFENPGQYGVGEQQVIDTTMRQAAFDLGMPADYAKATFGMVDIALNKIDPATPVNPHAADNLVAYLNTKHGDGADAFIETARATIAKMQPDAQEMVFTAVDRMPPAESAWMLNRMTKEFRS